MKTLKFTRSRLLVFLSSVTIAVVLMSSSHREAPLISNDPQADNTDVYAFRDPNYWERVDIIANYYPLEVPDGGPNYYHFGENIRYEIHIDNNIKTQGDDIIYRFTFKKTNEDPTTFFDVRLGKENNKTTYRLERSMDGGKSFKTIINNGTVPPPNIGPRSITSPVGLSAPSYEKLFNDGIEHASTGERVFCGPVDDPFFVDAGGIFDLGDAPRTTGTKPRDLLRCKNVLSIALQIDVSTLQKDHLKVTEKTTPLDPDYVIGVWASASRRSMRVLNGDGTQSEYGKWVQVSRLGMPLTNEAVIPVGYKDLWNSMSPYDDIKNLATFGKFFYTPELALYMDDHFFGSAVPAFKDLRIQRNSLGTFGFGNDQDGLYPLKGTAAVSGTALDDALFGNLLLPGPKSPRSVDLWPIFHTGVPNLPPYQLATGKNGNPLAEGKPFINNFLPNGGDMLRLNMAVPPTKRDDPKFSSLGLIQAAVAGLTDPEFNQLRKRQPIPNMDGFPNGRRLEDDVTRIELQAVSGVVLAAIGLWYDDYQPGGNPVTPGLVQVLTYKTGINSNDVAFRKEFPFEQLPWSGTSNCSCDDNSMMSKDQAVQEDALKNAVMTVPSQKLNLSAPEVALTASPNPVANSTIIKYHIAKAAQVSIVVFDAAGKELKVLENKKQLAGTYTINWNTGSITRGTYFINAIINGNYKHSVKIVKE